MSSNHKLIYTQLTFVRFCHVVLSAQRFYFHGVDVVSSGMGAVLNRCGPGGVKDDTEPVIEECNSETAHCPTCQGTGRFSRGEQQPLGP